MSTTVAARSAAERWFLDRGLPAVLTRRARLQAVWSRQSISALTLLELMSRLAYLKLKARFL